MPYHTSQQAALDREVLLQVMHLEQHRPLRRACFRIGPDGLIANRGFGNHSVRYWYSVQRTQWPGRASVSGTGSGPRQVGFLGAGQLG